MFSIYTIHYTTNGKSGCRAQSVFRAFSSRNQLQHGKTTMTMLASKYNADKRSFIS